MVKTPVESSLFSKGTMNDDDVYTELKGTVEDATTEENVDFGRASNEVITIDDVAFAYTDDVVVYVVDTDGDITVGSINRNYSDVTVTYIVNDDDAVTTIFSEK